MKKRVYDGLKEIWSFEEFQQVFRATKQASLRVSLLHTLPRLEDVTQAVKVQFLVDEVVSIKTAQRGHNMTLERTGESEVYQTALRFALRLAFPRKGFFDSPPVDWELTVRILELLQDDSLYLLDSGDRDPLESEIKLFLEHCNSSSRKHKWGDPEREPSVKSLWQNAAIISGNVELLDRQDTKEFEEVLAVHSLVHWLNRFDGKPQQVLRDLLKIPNRTDLTWLTKGDRARARTLAILLAKTGTWSLLVE